MRVFFILVILYCLFFSIIQAQSIQKDIGIFREYKNEFLDSIETESDKFLEKPEKPDIRFKMNFQDLVLPTNISDYEKFWHNEPISQGYSGMCWCFSTTSYFESEVYRLTKRKFKFSELYTVYWEYVEKAKRYVQERGDSEFGEGSEANAVIRIWKKYGVVPSEMYTGLKPVQKFHDHRQMFEEMELYLKSIKETNAWNEEQAIATIKSILNHYLGEPPQLIEYKNKKLTPLQYLHQVVELDLDNYIDFMSLKEKPYNQYVEYVVPDNWWHSEEYYNVPLEDFMKILKKAARSGHSVCLGGDVSEPGYDAKTEVAMVPTFDIPAEYIDENARQLRFSNESTTDDHGIHIVGFLEKDGKDWYLIKDSGSGSRNGPHEGYYFYHEDYIKLKMMNIMVPKDIVKTVLSDFE
jgi:bleomycin hydrolase